MLTVCNLACLFSLDILSISVFDSCFVPFQPFPTFFSLGRSLDITRECRGDNKRLINYLCRPEVISALVALCIDVHGSRSSEANAPVGDSTTPHGFPNASDEHPTKQSKSEAANDAPDPLSASTESLDDSDSSSDQNSSSVDDGNEDSQGSSDSADEAEEDARKTRLTRSYIASELLSADVRPLADALVHDDRIMNDLFSCLDDSEAGELDSYVASHFAKIISSLLKTRNDETLAQMIRCKDVFITGLLKHIALPPVAELVVRVLDGPDVDRGYTPTIGPPTRAALDLLVQSDILNGLANRFVQAASPHPADVEDCDERRVREETMANITITIQGIATRVLQLLGMDIRVPPKLNPYKAPGIVMQMLYAGLDTYDNRQNAEEASTTQSPARGESLDANTEKRTASGSPSALLHALSLGAMLMTTDANVHRDEAQEQPMPFGLGGPPGLGGPSGRQMMFIIGGRSRGGPPYGRGGGIAASIQSERRGDELSRSANESETGRASNTRSRSGDESDPVSDDPDSVDEPSSPGHLEVGSPIASTAALEAELVGSFQRLSEMFGSDEADEAKCLPLGSLRLKLAEFFVACMKKASQGTVDVIVKLGVPRTLIVLFRRYEWSSMLHGVVTRSIVTAFEEPASPTPARKAWIEAGLISWLTDAWALNDRKAEAEEHPFRAGYMGHLIQIGFAIQRFVEEHANLPALNIIPADQREALRKFNEEHLKPAHEIESTPLGGERPGHGVGVSDGEDVCDEATEVFDVVDVVEGISQGDENEMENNVTKYLDYRPNYDENPDSLGDVSHFGPDGNDDDSDDINDDEDDEVAVVDTGTMEGIHESAPSDRTNSSSSGSTASSSSHAGRNSVKSSSRDLGDEEEGGRKRMFRDNSNERRKDSAELFFGSAFDSMNDSQSSHSSGWPLPDAPHHSKLDSSARLRGHGAAKHDKRAHHDDSSEDDEGTYDEYVDAQSGPDDAALSSSMNASLNLGANTNDEDARETASPASKPAHPTKQARFASDADVRPKHTSPSGVDSPESREELSPETSSARRSVGTREGATFVQEEAGDSSEDDAGDWFPFVSSADAGTVDNQPCESEVKNSL